MKLSLLHEAGHWNVLKDYPNSTLPNKGKQMISPLLHPKDRNQAGITQGGEFGKSGKRRRRGPE